jgi:hypothetical protein
MCLYDSRFSRSTRNHMEEIEVPVNPQGREEQLALLIEEAVTHYGLQIRMKGTLRMYPGSQHWHVCKPGEKGTLEVTLWPAGKRLWFSVQARRRAEWIAEIIPLLKVRVQERLPKP